MRDREVVIEAIRQNGGALWSVSEELKDDRDVLMEAVRQNGGALQFASEELKHYVQGSGDRGRQAEW